MRRYQTALRDDECYGKYICVRFSLRRASTLSVEYKVSRLYKHSSSQAVRLQTRVFALAQKTPAFLSYGAPFGKWRAAISLRRNPFAELVDARAPALARCVWQFRHGGCNSAPTWRGSVFPFCE